MDKAQGITLNAQSAALVLLGAVFGTTGTLGFDRLGTDAAPVVVQAAPSAAEVEELRRRMDRVENKIDTIAGDVGKVRTALARLEAHRETEGRP